MILFLMHALGKKTLKAELLGDCHSCLSQNPNLMYGLRLGDCTEAADGENRDANPEFFHNL